MSGKKESSEEIVEVFYPVLVLLFYILFLAIVFYGRLKSFVCV